MTRYVAFLRAVNVAGHARVTMTDVRDGFAAAGCRNVCTYIQSGNILFESGEAARPLVERIRRALAPALGGEPQILLRTTRQLAAIVAADPFNGYVSGSRLKLYVSFLFRRPARAPALPFESPGDALTAIATSGHEVFVVSRPRPNGFFGLPNNFVEARLGVAATTRNWRTVVALAARAQSSSG